MIKFIGKSRIDGYPIIKISKNIVEKFRSHFSKVLNSGFSIDINFVELGGSFLKDEKYLRYQLSHTPLPRVIDINYRGKDYLFLKVYMVDDKKFENELLKFKNVIRKEKLEKLNNVEDYNNK